MFILFASPISHKNRLKNSQNTGFAKAPYRRHLIRRYEKLPALNKVVRLFHHGAASLCDTSGWLGGEHTRKGDSESSEEYPHHLIPGNHLFQTAGYGVVCNSSLYNKNLSDDLPLPHLSVWAMVNQNHF